MTARRLAWGPEDVEDYALLKVIGDKMQSVRQNLILHPDCRSAAVTGIAVEVTRPGGALALRYVVEGNIAEVRLPPTSASVRADELWRHTCFEAFIRVPDGEGYAEFNFAPSTQWAAYCFDGYRDGMRDAPLAAPRIDARAGNESYELSVLLRAPSLRGALRLALSTVIEETSGEKSYWALAHPPGKPDFHHADGFVLELP